METQKFRAMQIFVKMLSGKSITFDVVPDTEIGDFEDMVGEEVGLGPRRLDLYFGDTELYGGVVGDRWSSQCLTLADYKIVHESVLQLIVNPPDVHKV